MFLSIVLPAAGMLALLSGPLIELLFGAQWSRSAPLASMLCIFFMCQAPVLLAPSTLVASGHVGLMMRCRVLAEFTRVVVLLSSVLVPLETVVMLLGIAYLAEGVIFTLALRARLGIGMRALWRSVRKCYGLVPMTVALPAVAMFLLQHQGQQSSALQIAVAGTLGVLCWFGSLLWLRHPMADEVLALLRKLLQGAAGLRRRRS
jgi:O-antigen/teichoic acid export membrane protein